MSPWAICSVYGPDSTDPCAQPIGPLYAQGTSLSFMGLHVDAEVQLPAIAYMTGAYDLF